MNKKQKVIQQLSDKQLYHHVLLTQLILIVIAVVLGIFLFQDFQSFLTVLKLDFFVVLIGVVAGLLVVTIDIWLMKALPKQYYDDGGVNEKLFSSLSPAKIVFLTLCIAISEEVLFRGVIHTNSGIVVASFVFAFVHFRYFAHWFLALNILILSFFIGGIYEWTESLWATIILHFIVDCILGLYLLKLSRHNKREEGESHETRSI